MNQQDAVAVPGDASAALAPLTLSDAAVGRLRRAMTENGIPTDAALRVFVAGGGCSGLQYGLGFETARDEGDAVFESGGMAVVVDPVSILYLQGARIDYVEGPTGGAFKIDNPNAEAACGCGGSFREGQRDAGAGAGCPGCAG